MKLLNNQYAVVEFNEEANYIKLTWKKSAPHQEHQEIISQCLKAIEVLKCHKLMTDVRNIGIIKSWIEQEWLSNAKVRGLEEIAFLINENAYYNIVSKRSSKVEEKSEGIINHMFRNEIIAEQWLLSAS
jgi:hypothetical protein